LKILSIYDEANDKMISGKQETTPNYETLTYSREQIITSYNVSSKIYLAEQMFRDCASKASSLEKIPELIQIQHLIIEAANQAAEGINIYAKGYYVKAVDYTGQWEKGRALKKGADYKIANACELLIPIINKHFLDFPENTKENIQFSIKYYHGELE
jgi:hypothetical protein